MLKFVSYPASVKSYKTKQDIIKVLQDEIKNIYKPCDVTGWMDLIRTCRQPQSFWEVDYIEPTPQLLEINNYIKKSESLIYKNKQTLKMKNGYMADLSQQIAFNTIRARLRSEENNIDTSISMFQEMLEEWYDKITPIRQSNLLFHCCLCFLCCEMFEQSYDCFEKHWILLKYSDKKDRVSLGLWDNQTILQLAYWFFIKHHERFRDFYSVRTDSMTSEIYNHKKIAMLNFLEYDNSWLVSFCGLPFYQHARKSMPALPVYEKKRSTPINLISTWQSTTEWEDTESIGLERHYFDEYNRETLHEYRIDYDKLDDYLYSYYHFQNDYVLDRTNQSNLVQFLHNYVSLKEYHSILEAGCGLHPLPTAKYHIKVDISKHVCNLLKESGDSIVHKEISRFLQETDERFDVCFACDLLQNLRTERLKSFMKICATKCKYLVALIDTRDDIRSDILSKRRSPSQINLHHTVIDINNWLNMLSQYFNVKHRSDDHYLYAFCEPR